MGNSPGHSDFNDIENESKRDQELAACNILSQEFVSKYLDDYTPRKFKDFEIKPRVANVYDRHKRKQESTDIIDRDLSTDLSKLVHSADTKDLVWGFTLNLEQKFHVLGEIHKSIIRETKRSIGKKDEASKAEKENALKLSHGAKFVLDFATGMHLFYLKSLLKKDLSEFQEAIDLVEKLVLQGANPLSLRPESCGKDVASALDPVLEFLRELASPSNKDSSSQVKATMMVLHIGLARGSLEDIISFCESIVKRPNLKKDDTKYPVVESLTLLKRLKPMTTCNSNHGLTFTQSEETRGFPAYNCNGCGDHQKLTDGCYFCKDCNFDACPDCHSGVNSIAKSEEKSDSSSSPEEAAELKLEPEFFATYEEQDEQHKKLMEKYKSSGINLSLACGIVLAELDRLSSALKPPSDPAAQELARMGKCAVLNAPLCIEVTPGVVSLLCSILHNVSVALFKTHWAKPLFVNMTLCALRILKVHLYHLTIANLSESEFHVSDEKITKLRELLVKILELPPTKENDAVRLEASDVVLFGLDFLLPSWSDKINYLSESLVKLAKTGSVDPADPQSIFLTSLLKQFSSFQTGIRLSEYLLSSPKTTANLRTLLSKILSLWSTDLFSFLDEQQPLTTDIYKMLSNLQKLVLSKAGQWDDVPDEKSTDDEKASPPGLTVVQDLFVEYSKELFKKCTKITKKCSECDEKHSESTLIVLQNVRELSHPVVTALCMFAAPNRLQYSLRLLPEAINYLEVIGVFEKKCHSSLSNVEFLKTVAWLCGMLAGVLVQGSPSISFDRDHKSWVNSTLLMGGLESSGASGLSSLLDGVDLSNTLPAGEMKEPQETRDHNAFLKDLIEDKGKASKLTRSLEKYARDHRSIIQKSIALVANRATRCVFAVLLKHTNRTKQAINFSKSKADLIPNQNLIKLWKSAINVKVTIRTMYGGDEGGSKSVDEFVARVESRTKFLLSFRQNGLIAPAISTEDVKVHRATSRVKSPKRAGKKWQKVKHVTQIMAMARRALKQLKELIHVRTRLAKGAQDQMSVLVRQVLEFINSGQIDIAQIQQQVLDQKARAVLRLMGLNYFHQLTNSVKNLAVLPEILRHLSVSFRSHSKAALENVRKGHVLYSVHSTGAILRQELTTRYFRLLQNLLKYAQDSRGGDQLDDSSRLILLDVCNLGFTENDVQHLQKCGILEYLQPMLMFNASPRSILNDEAALTDFRDSIQLRKIPWHLKFGSWILLRIFTEMVALTTTSDAFSEKTKATTALLCDPLLKCLHSHLDNLFSMRETAVVGKKDAPQKKAGDGSKWKCKSCTNMLAENLNQCTLCLAARYESSDLLKSDKKKSAAGEMWQCENCTFLNTKDKRKCDVCQSELTFQYTAYFQEKDDKNGIIYYLGTSEKKEPWVNPHKTGVVEVTASSVKDGDLTATLEREDKDCATNDDEENPWFAINFRSKKVLATHVTLGNHTSEYYNWVFEGSNDGIAWDLIQKFDSSASNGTKYFALGSPHESYVHFRVKLLDKNGRGDWTLGLSSFELYGVLSEASSSTYIAAPSPANWWDTEIPFDHEKKGNYPDTPTTVTNTHSSTKWQMVKAAKIWATGKHSFAIKMDCPRTTPYKCIGVMPADHNTATSDQNMVGGLVNGFGYRGNGKKVTNNDENSYGQEWAWNDIIRVEVNMDAGNIEFFKNGDSQGMAYEGEEALKRPLVAAASTDEHEVHMQFIPYFESGGSSAPDAKIWETREANLHLNDACVGWFESSKSDIDRASRFLSRQEEPSRAEVDIYSNQILWVLLESCTTEVVCKALTAPVYLKTLLLGTMKGSQTGRILCVRILRRVLHHTNAKTVLGLAGDNYFEDMLESIGRDCLRTVPEEKFSKEDIPGYCEEQQVHSAVTSELVSLVRVLHRCKDFYDVINNLINTHVYFLKELSDQFNAIGDRISQRKDLGVYDVNWRSPEIPPDLLKSLFCLLGALCELGGDFESIREGALVEVENDGEKVRGIIVSMTKLKDADGDTESQWEIYVALDDQELKFTERSKLTPVPDVSIPVSRISDPVEMLKTLCDFFLETKYPESLKSFFEGKALFAQICRRVLKVVLYLIELPELGLEMVDMELITVLGAASSEVTEPIKGVKHLTEDNLESRIQALNDEYFTKAMQSSLLEKQVKLYRCHEESGVAYRRSKDVEDRVPHDLGPVHNDVIEVIKEDGEWFHCSNGYFVPTKSDDKDLFERFNVVAEKKSDSDDTEQQKKNELTSENLQTSGFPADWSDQAVKESPTDPLGWLLDNVEKLMADQNVKKDEADKKVGMDISLETEINTTLNEDELKPGRVLPEPTRIDSDDSLKKKTIPRFSEFTDMAQLVHYDVSVALESAEEALSAIYSRQIVLSLLNTSPVASTLVSEIQPFFETFIRIVDHCNINGGLPAMEGSLLTIMKHEAAEFQKSPAKTLVSLKSSSPLLRTLLELIVSHFVRLCNCSSPDEYRDQPDNQKEALTGPSPRIALWICRMFFKLFDDGFPELLNIFGQLIPSILVKVIAVTESKYRVSFMQVLTKLIQLNIKFSKNQKKILRKVMNTLKESSSQYPSFYEIVNINIFLETHQKSDEDMEEKEKPKSDDDSDSAEKDEKFELQPWFQELMSLIEILDAFADHSVPRKIKFPKAFVATTWQQIIGWDNADDSPWNCGKCTYENSAERDKCEMCEASKPEPESSDEAGKLYTEFMEFDEKFKPSDDEALVELIDHMWTRSGDEPPDQYTPKNLKPPTDLLVLCKLDTIPLEDIKKRFTFIQKLNKKLSDALEFTDLCRPKGGNIIADKVKDSRGLMFLATKVEKWKAGLSDTSNHYSKENFELDRFSSRRLVEAGRPDINYSKSLFGQLFQGFRNHATERFRLGNEERAWKAVFLGEFSDDHGGPYNEVLETLVTELQSPVLPLLLRSPNGRENIGANRDKWVPNPSATSSLHISLYHFLGQLMGLCLRTGHMIALDLPSIVWKQLVGAPITKDDVLKVDLLSFKILEELENLKQYDLSADIFESMIDCSFTVTGSDQKMHPLVPDGHNVKVTTDNTSQFAEALRSYRLSEFKTQTEAIREGMATIVPYPILSLFTWKQLEKKVCGVPSMDLQLLMEQTEYDKCSENDEFVKFFWRMMREKWNDEKRAKFLTFVWGRSRLPNRKEEFERKFKIEKGKESDDHLPVSHTCFFTLDLPTYSSLDVMTQKMEYAITHCVAIDGDETSEARRAAEQAVLYEDVDEEE